MLLFVNNCGNDVYKESSEKDLVPFGISYSQFSADEAKGYNLLITEPYFTDQNEIKDLQNNGTKVLAYLSLGEVHPNRNYFELFRKSGLRGRNNNQESYFIDLSEEQVSNTFLYRVIPEYISKGFDGLFLDTIDAVAPWSERKDQQGEMVELIRSIRTRFPELIIVQNAGFFLLDETSDYVDAVAIEGVATSYSFADQSYNVASDQEYSERIGLVDSLNQTFKKPIFVIEFMDDSTRFPEISSRLDTTSHPYFISNIAFRGLPPVRQKAEVY